MTETIRSNAEYWKELQRGGYFENHPCYKGIAVAGGQECLLAIGRFRTLEKTMRMVVIGCGYGRETLKLAPEVGIVYGIDVEETILNKAVRFLSENGVRNFVPVAVDNYKRDIPDGIDLVFSIVVMQHLTRDLVRDYFKTLGAKLAPGGSFVVQFLEELYEGVERVDAELKPYEPSVSWSLRQLAALSQETGLAFKEVHSLLVTPTALWHWVHFQRP